MLPWTFIHGYWHCTFLIRMAQVASMLPWTFIHGYSSPLMCRIISFMRFNVAMDFHPWIHVMFRLTTEAESLLQCCHGFSSMDTTTQATTGQVTPVLLQCCHGFSSMDTVFLCISYTFGVEASMLPWIFIHGYRQ